MGVSKSSLRGGHRGPLSIDYWNAAKSMYRPSEFQPGNGFEPLRVENAAEIEETGEIRAWKRDKDRSILIAIRGTANSGDVQTDLLIPAGLLTSSQRWASTKTFLNELYEQCGKKYKYYLTGHSLGGALATQALQAFPWITFAREYNPAVEPFYSAPAFIKNRVDVYNTNDPLYNTSGYNQTPISLVKSEDNYYTAHLLNSLKQAEEEESKREAAKKEIRAVKVRGKKKVFV